ncbi:MAG: hypothetical protein R3C19_18185 [Planctomycetaceae bacterium]
MFSGIAGTTANIADSELDFHSSSPGSRLFPDMLRYILQSAVYYRRINFVVMLAVAISTAVIGGSLIVGDSVRYSLRQMTLQRLGRITHVAQSTDFLSAGSGGGGSEAIRCRNCGHPRFC